MNRRRRRSQQAKSIAKDLEYEAKVVVIGEEESVCTGRFFVFEFLKIFFVAVFVEQIFFQVVCRVECNRRIEQECKWRKKKHYDLRLRDPDDAEQLK